MKKSKKKNIVEKRFSLKQKHIFNNKVVMLIHDLKVSNVLIAGLNTFE